MREQLMKIVRQRRYLINTGKSKKNICMCMRHIAKVEPWLKAFPHATDENVRRFAQKHRDSFEYLLPHGLNPAHTALSQTLNQIVYG